MRGPQLKPHALGSPWANILAVSLGASVPAAICRAARLQARLPPARALRGLPGAAGSLVGAVPSALEAAWPWQQRLEQPWQARAPRWARVAARSFETQTAAETAVEAGAAGGARGEQGAGPVSNPGADAQASSAPTREAQAPSANGNGADEPSSSGSAAAPQQLCFKAAAAVIPHPAKVEKGGEDAYFISDDGLALGVADGVGSWAEIGVDAGAYSRLLMRHAKALAEQTAAGEGAPQSVLVQAHGKTDAMGSCTACIVMLDGATLRAVNVGDSGFFVLRNSQILFRSPPQQHQFNFPFQLGGPESPGDPPESSEKFSVGLAAGDVVVLATDGVIDNVFAEETAAMMSVMHRRGDPPRVAAAGLAQWAKYRSEDTTHLSPFAYGAHQAGYRYMGGKKDDITVVVAYVSPASQL